MKTLYLDSSDYSNMAEPRNRQAQQIAGELFKWVHAGKGEVRYSAIHVLECAHVDKQSKPMALARIDSIQRLSGKKCMRVWTDLLDMETIALGQGVNLHTNYWKSDHGQWYPKLEHDEKSVRDPILRSIRKAISSTGLPRQQRRQIEKQFIQNEHITQKTIDILSINREELLKNMKDQFPLSDRFYEEDLLLKYMKSDITYLVLAAEIEECFRNPHVFVDWIHDSRDPEKKLTRWLRDSGSALIEKMEGLIPSGAVRDS